MKKKNDFIKSIIVLGSICLIVAVAMAAVNSVTAPIIAEAAANAETASLKNVLPDAGKFEKLDLPDGSPETVTAVYRDEGGTGYAVALSTKSSYSKSPMTFTLGIGTDGKIVGVEMTNYAETKDFGDYPQSYVGEDSALGGVDLFSGATYSSTAFKNAVSDAFAVLVDMGSVSEGEKSEEQLLEELKIMALPGAVDRAGKIHLTKIDIDSTPDKSNFFVYEAYRADNGTGYYIFLHDYSDGYCFVSPTGGIVFYDLYGSDKTAIHPTGFEMALNASDFSADREANLAAAQKAVDENAVLTPIKTDTLDKAFGTVVAAYSTGDSKVFVCNPYGYKEPMKLVFVVDGTGTITNFRPAGELIQDSEYYDDYSLELEGYRGGIIGKSEASFNTDDALISGATATAGGVTQAINDVFYAAKLSWEVAE